MPSSDNVVNRRNAADNVLNYQDFGISSIIKSLGDIILLKQSTDNRNRQIINVS